MLNFIQKLKKFSCALIVATLAFMPHHCFAAELSKVKRFVRISNMANLWDSEMLESATESFSAYIREHGNFTEEQLIKETEKIQQIFKTHFTYKLVSADLEQCLVESLTDSDVDFLIKGSLNMIPDTPENIAIFEDKFQHVGVCMRTVGQIKIHQLKQEGKI